MTALPTGYNTMRFLRAGLESSVWGTGLTLINIAATGTGVVLIYRDEAGKTHRQYLDQRSS